MTVCEDYTRELPKHGVYNGLTNCAPAHCTGLQQVCRLLSTTGMRIIFEGHVEVTEMNTMWKVLMVTLVPAPAIWR